MDELVIINFNEEVHKYSTKEERQTFKNQNIDSFVDFVKTNKYFITVNVYCFEKTSKYSSFSYYIKPSSDFLMKKQILDKGTISYGRWFWPHGSWGRFYIGEEPERDSD